ncbi:MAG: hypothetical protein KatS3mg023_3687 [Armatimonadota bacterium]|nr:MAG: hypothetical protein KatS3mg023_3687 [Armatimonadota bacterium]
MDLERWIVEPRVGEVESESPRPLSETVQAVVDGSVSAGGEPDEFSRMVDGLLELVPYARPDFHEPLGDDVWDDLFESLVDADTLSDEQYQRYREFVRREFSSAVLRSFVRQYGNLTGLDYVPPGKQTAEMVRLAVSDFVGRSRRAFDDIGSETLKGMVFEFMSSGYLSMYRAWTELEKEFSDSGLPSDARERQLELAVRDLESSIGQRLDRAYRAGRAVASLSVEGAREMLSVVHSLLELIRLVMNGLDLTLAMLAVRVRVDFKRWESIVRAQIEDLFKRELAQVMRVLGAQVLMPLMGQVNRIRTYMHVIERLTGDLKELDLLGDALDEVEEWKRRYYAWIDSLRGGVRESASVCFNVSVQVQRYDRLWRRRRLCVQLKRVLESFRKGIQDGLSSP